MGCIANILENISASIFRIKVEELENYVLYYVIWVPENGHFLSHSFVASHVSGDHMNIYSLNTCYLLTLTLKMEAFGFSKTLAAQLICTQCKNLHTLLTYAVNQHDDLSSNLRIFYSNHVCAHFIFQPLDKF